MTTQEIKEKLEKAIVNVTKAEKSLAKHEAKLAKLNPNTYEYDWEAYEVKSAKNKLEEKKNTVKNWEKKLAKAQENEDTLSEIPEAFREAKEALVADWVQYDIRQREKIKAFKKECLQDAKTNAEIREGYDKFRKVVKYTTEETYMKTDEDFRRIEEKEANEWLIDLYKRVKDITGNITDASGIHWGGKCLDGIIKGEKGTAEVETIEAGGYNIQRWHLRTLVKER